MITVAERRCLEELIHARADAATDWAIKHMAGRDTTEERERWRATNRALTTYLHQLTDYSTNESLLEAS